MDAGDYVPDEVTNAMVARPAGRAGLPTPGSCSTASRAPLDQADELDAMLAARQRLDVVVELVADADEVVAPAARARRRSEGRSDDTEAVIRRRLEVYARADRAAGRVLRASAASLRTRSTASGAVDEVTEPASSPRLRARA